MITIPTADIHTVASTPKSAKPRQLLTPLPDPGHFLLVIDNSSMEKFTTCPRSAEYYLVDQREGHAKNAALTFGSAIHVGLESIEHSETDLLTAQKVLRYFTENPAPPDEYRTPQIALELLAHYRVRRTFPDYSWKIETDTAGPLIERAFELPLGVLEVNASINMPWLPSDQGAQPVSHIHVAWSGRIDVIAECNGKVRVVDNKTTSISGDQFVQDFQLSNQTIGYVWAAQQLWPNLSVSGFCLNAIALKKPGKGQGLMDKGVRGGDPPLSFFRAYFDYTESRLQQWEHNALVLVEDFVHNLIRSYHPTHTKWCFGKYGRCPYHDVCVNDDPVVRHNILHSDMYRSVTWNPTDER